MSNIENHYVIFSGTFTYKREEFLHSTADTLEKNYQPWFKNKPRINPTTYSILHSQYYPSFLECTLPEYSFIHSFTKEELPGIHVSDYVQKMFSSSPALKPIRLTSKACRDLHGIRIKSQDKPPVRFDIEYADVLFYPEDMGIFLFKAVISESDKPKGATTLEQISTLIFQLRTLDTVVTLPDETNLTMTEFLHQYLLHQSEFSAAVQDLTQSSFQDKLKTYTVIEKDLDVTDPSFPTQENEILYEMGSVAPVGTVQSNGQFAPSDHYFSHIIDTHKISVFKWWSALSLHDTVTVLINTPESRHRQFSTFSTFEDMYLHVYLEVLFLKFSMFENNLELSQIPLHHKYNRLLRDRMIELRNRYEFSHISNNFLPNVLYSYFKSGMDVENEVEQMEQKFERINNFITEKQERRTNVLLTFISFLAIGSAFLDTSDWLAHLFSLSDLGYIAVSVGLAGTTFIIGISVLIMNSRAVQKRRAARVKRKLGTTERTH